MEIPNTIAQFEDKYGNTRKIHRDKKGRLSIAREQQTLSMALLKAVSMQLGQRIRSARLMQEMTMEDLCVRAGLRSVNPKERIWGIENATRGEGIRLGTLYAIASALKTQPSKLLPPMREVFKAANVKRQKIATLSTKSL